MTDKIKRSFFLQAMVEATIVSILLYRCTTWTLTKRLEKRLDGNNIRMLRAILNKTRRQHPTNILWWTPSHGRSKAGRPARTYIQQLCADTGFSLEDLPEVMDDRDGERERVREFPTSSVS